MSNNISEKQWLVTFLLCLMLGFLGAHRFYVGKIGTGILWLFSGGLLGIGVIYDIIMLLTSNFKDNQGNAMPMQISVNVNDQESTVGIGSKKSS